VGDLFHQQSIGHDTTASHCLSITTTTEVCNSVTSPSPAQQQQQQQQILQPR